MNSGKSFRFGNMGKYSSLGSVIAKGSVSGVSCNGASTMEELPIHTDVISLDVPLLMSKATLKSTHAELNFELDHLVINHSLRVPLINTAGGHIFFDWEPKHCSSVMEKREEVHVARESNPLEQATEDSKTQTESEIAVDIPQVNEDQILKAHIHLGHAESQTLLRIFKLAGKQITSEEIEKALARCKCDRIGGYPQNPVVSKYLPEMPGQSIFMDVFYPESAASFPSVLIVRAFSKFVRARFMNSLKPMMLVSVLINNWMCLFGMPESIICDRGTHFQGGRNGVLYATPTQSE